MRQDHYRLVQDQLSKVSALALAKSVSCSFQYHTSTSLADIVLSRQFLIRKWSFAPLSSLGALTTQKTKGPAWTGGPAAMQVPPPFQQRIGLLGCVARPGSTAKQHINSTTYRLRTSAMLMVATRRLLPFDLPSTKTPLPKRRMWSCSQAPTSPNGAQLCRPSTDLPHILSTTSALVNITTGPTADPSQPGQLVGQISDQRLLVSNQRPGKRRNFGRRQGRSRRAMLQRSRKLR